MKRLAVLIGVVGAAGVVASCASGPELRPARSARTVRGTETVAVAEVAGVRLQVDGGAWDGFPRELDEVVPVKVTVLNGSGHPLRIRFEDLALVGPAGSEFVALPPLQITGTERTAVGGAPVAGYAPGFVADRYFVADAYAPFYTGLTPWAGTFGYDPLYYDTYYSAWPVQLPTPSMIEKALPEGVIDPGGRVSGFVYFQDVPEGIERVTLRARLVDAKTSERLGVVEIPMLTDDA